MSVKNKSGNFSVWRDDSGNSNNCENFTNVCALGLNFSELDDRKDNEIRNSESDGIMIEVGSSIKETTRKLDNLTTYTPYSKMNDIKGYIDQGNSKRMDTYVDREGIEMDEIIEVQPKSDYNEW